MIVKFEGSFFLAGRKRSNDPREKEFQFVGQILSVVGNEYVYVATWDDGMNKAVEYELIPINDIDGWEFYAHSNQLRSAIGIPIRHGVAI